MTTNRPVVSRPVLLLSVWLISVVVLVNFFLFAAVFVQTKVSESQPAGAFRWLFQWGLSVAAIVVVVVSAYALFRLIARAESIQTTKPVSLLAVWLIGIGFLVGSFLFAAIRIGVFTSLALILVTMAILIFPVFLYLFFLLLGYFKIEPPAQEESLSHRIAQQGRASWERTVYGELFVPDSTQSLSQSAWSEEQLDEVKSSFDNIDLRLSHAWRFSTIPPHRVDIVIRLEGDLGKGTSLSEQQVSSVEYRLWPGFSPNSITKTDAGNGFQLMVLANQPVFCSATVNFTDGKPAVRLNEYIGFF